MTASLALVPNLMAMQAGADKMLHLLVFCMLMIWPAIVWESRRAIAISACILLTLGCGIEILQIYVPQRRPEVMDAVFNMGGILLGSTIGYLFRDSYRALLPLAEARIHMRAYKIKG